MAHNLNKLFLLLILLFSFSGVVTGAQVSGDANTKNSTMQALLEELKQRILAEPGFSVTFQFAYPLIKDDDTWWSVPYFDKNFELTRSLGDIGQDYVCFAERWGDQDQRRCTPFSNLVTVVYSPNNY